MTITTTVQAPISKGNANSISDSITMIAGDVLLYCIHNRDTFTFAAPQWNGQTLTEVAGLSPYSFLRVFFIKAAASATANVTSTAGGFSATNTSWAVLRSSTNAFSANPLKEIKTMPYISGIYTDPAVTLSNLSTGNHVVAFLGWSGFNTGFANVQSTTAVENNLTAGGVIQNSFNQSTPGRTYVSSGSGYSGNTVVGYTKSGSGSPVHGLIAIAVEESSQLITSINSGNPVTVGQTGVVIAHTGFSGALDSVTTNRSGVTCTITAGNASSTTVTVSGWVEGGAYPVVDNTVTFTCTRGAESASATQTLTKPANYAQVTFSGAITDDPNLIGYHLNAAGHVVDGGAFYYRNNQVATLTVNADTSWTADPAGGTFRATFIPITGATAGNSYFFDITVINGSIADASGLSVAGLSNSGISNAGLSVSGL